MGVEHPWGKAQFVTWDDAFHALKAQNLDDGDANVGAAIGEAESGLDLTVLNNTPATGDYSVGIWQINYYGSLYAGRVADYGTPKSLATSGLAYQANVCERLFRQSGWSPWSTYNSGAYRQYLSNKYPFGGKGGAQQVNYPDPFIKPPTGDYSDTILSAAGQLAGVGNRFSHTAAALRDLRR